MNIARVQTMAEDCLRYHGLTALHWRFEFDRAVRRIGRCSYKRKVISISRPLAEINSDDIILDTILHEIAHALVGCEANHGREWKIVARSIGAKPERCADIRGNFVQVQQPFTGTCSDCGLVMHRPRRPKPQMLAGAVHTRCRWKPNRGRILWKHHGQPLTA